MIAIIGAGIGGLTTAIALKRANIPFCVYEAADTIKPVGAGIIMANNAMQVFQHFGIAGQIQKKGNPLSVTNLTKPDFTSLSYIRLNRFEQKFGLQNHAIHRADLHGVLMDAAGTENIATGKRLSNICKKDSSYQLIFEDGSYVNTEYIIAADGIKSRVRELLFDENTYRNAKQICWRGVVDFQLHDQYRHELVEAWGRGRRFGFVQLNDRQVYWYLLINSGLGGINDNPLDFTESFNPLAKALVKATPSKTIIGTHLYDLKPVDCWYKEKVCLLGDAAHATTPNLGQGACQAIEDAYTLDRLLAKYPIEKAMSLYPELRRKKAHEVVSLSWKFGKMAHLSNALAIGIRNVLLKATPESINLKQMDWLFTLNNID